MSATKNNAAPSGLHQKITEIMQSVDHIEKDGYNKHHGYAFTSEAMFLRTFRAEMSSRNVTMFPSIQPGSVQVHEHPKGFVTTCVAEYTFTDGDTGECFKTSTVAQGYDSLDKGAFKAMTGGIKYALRQTFMVPSGDDPEDDSVSPERKTDDDDFQWAALPPETSFGATVHEAKWIKTKNGNRLLLIASVANKNGGLPAGEKIWLQYGKPDYRQAGDVFAATADFPENGDVSDWVGRPFDLTVNLGGGQGQYRNFNISRATPVEVPDVA